MGRTGETEARAALADAAAVGNAERLKQYWTTGPGGQRIRWEVEEGNLQRCHDEVSKEVPAVDMTSDDVWGYCQNLHKRVFGVPNPSD
jgi:hypothetical protein